MFNWKHTCCRLETFQNRSIEKIDGRPFLQSHPQYKPSWHDLDHFLECEKDKDYAKYFDRLRKFKDFKDKKFLIKKNTMKKRMREDMLGLLWGDAEISTVHLVSNANATPSQASSFITIWYDWPIY
jgi:glycogen synthase